MFIALQSLKSVAEGSYRFVNRSCLHLNFSLKRIGRACLLQDAVVRCSAKRSFKRENSGEVARPINPLNHARDIYYRYLIIKNKVKEETWNINYVA